MTGLREALEEYIAIRRGLGFEFRGAAHWLRDFVTFAEGEDASVITVDLALRWVKYRDVEAATMSARLGMVRGFAVYRIAEDPRTEVPPAGLLPYRYRRKPPHIYSDGEVDRLIEAAAALPSKRGFRGRTCATLFGLLAVTGLRIGEAIGLDREDADLDAGVITIRRAKFGHPRLVPLHDSTRLALQRYATRREETFCTPMTRAFFVSDRGTRFKGCTARYNFARVCQQIGLRTPTEGYRHGHGPRLHDLRHRFAVKTMIDWYRAGRDVERELPKLSTYLGHVHVADTYWYLEAVPELLDLATQRLIDSHEGSGP